MGLPNRADIKDADEWWGTLSDEKRVSTHRWLAGLGKMPPPSQPEVLFDIGAKDDTSPEAEEATEAQEG